MVQKNSIRPEIIIICGATATGKSDLAIKLAQKLNTEVISADSMYIYRNLDVGTAKPKIAEMQGVKHHLIDIIDPENSFTVSDYKSAAEPIIKDLISQNKIPIICGGTGFYINSILYDLSYGNGADNMKVREKYKSIAEEFGNERVYNILKEVDPISANKLHFNDLKRVIRALEIYENGSKKSDINDDFTPKYKYRAYAVSYSRDLLYERINKRVDLMIKSGLINEINELISRGIGHKHQCMQAIGYKEILDFIDGKCSLDDAIEKIKLNTRHYAKRQITYFKKLDGLVQLDAAPTDVLTDKILQGIEYD